MVDVASDFDGAESDGIIGLAPTSNDGAELLVDVLANSGVIDKKEFTVYIGKSGVDDSYIEFGSNTDDKTNITYLALSPLSTGQPQFYWSTKLSSFKYGTSEFSFTTANTVWDTGTSILGMSSSNLKRFILFVANGKNAGLLDGGFYAIKCNSISDFEDIHFTFGSQTINVSKYEYLIKSGGLCVFMIFELSEQEDFILLGDSFLRGMKIVHDVQGLKLGFYPQRTYKYGGDDSSSLLWLWILLG